MSPRYHVLSLDLHDTVVWDTPAIVEAQYAVRLNLLARGLRGSDGNEISFEDLRTARNALHSNWQREGRYVESVPVATQVEQLRQRLSAECATPVEQVVKGYAEGGLREHPPIINPEARELVVALNQVGFPVIVITDTSRSGSAWKSFLEGAGSVRLTDVVASTDVGACKPDHRIFSEAARRAGVPSSDILHAGDSWAWDVEGARECGMGAALYRGLRSRYWDPDSPREPPPARDPSVPRLDHLSEVRELLGLA